MNKDELIRKFDAQAEGYARRRRRQSGAKWRKKIFASVKGKTLELAVGSGMNFAYVPRSVDYTGVDFSPAMLGKAKVAAQEYGVPAAFILSAVESLDFEEGTFDTVISSGSLCGYDDPVGVLNKLNRWCKPEGHVLLLEHGLFSSPTLSWLQRKLDPLSVRIMGCHQDRDILEIVRRSELIIDKQERALGGYLYLIWARPSSAHHPAAGVPSCRNDPNPSDRHVPADESR